jgi:HNH endonuclease
VGRDRDCVVNGCHRPADWCDGHHVKWWKHGGETKLENLALVCRRHHRMLHEEGWTIERTGGRWVTKPPPHRVETHARSA